MDTKKLRRLASQIIALCDEEDYKQNGDLFAGMDAAIQEFDQAVEDLHPSHVEEPVLQPTEAPEEEAEASEPKYRHIGVKMQEAGMVRVSQRIGKKEGFCRRESIEKTLVRTTGRTPEDVREAVNAATSEMRLTCFFWNKYRFYRSIDKVHLMTTAEEYLRRTA